MPASMRCRLCCGFHACAGFRAAGDARHDGPIDDRPIYDGPILPIAPDVAAQDNDIDDDGTRDDGAGGSCTFNDATAAGGTPRRTEGGHDCPVGVSVAAAARGQALRL